MVVYILNFCAALEQLPHRHITIYQLYRNNPENPYRRNAAATTKLQFCRKQRHITSGKRTKENNMLKKQTKQMINQKL